MFRLIAISLTSTFILLGLFGAGGEPPTTGTYAVTGLPADLRTPSIHPQLPVLYVSAPAVPLHEAPAPDAGIIDELPAGARVQLIDARLDGFARVRDDIGRLGYLSAEALSMLSPG